MSVRTTSTLAAGLLGMWALTAMPARPLIAVAGVFGLVAAAFGLYIPDSPKVRIRRVCCQYAPHSPSRAHRGTVAKSTQQHDASWSRRRSVLRRGRRAAEAERMHGGSRGEEC